MGESMVTKVLVVCSNDSFAGPLRALLEESRECRVDAAKSALEGRGLARDHDYDVILINAPLESELGDAFARTVTRITYSAIMILVPEQIADSMARKVEGHGIWIVKKPLHKQDFLEAFDRAVLSSERSKVLYEENQKLKRKIRELNTISRAKVLLVEYLKLSEDQAHKYIEQQAMERRQTAGEVAESIIKTYEI